MPNFPPVPTVNRGFANIEEGQAHYYTAGPDTESDRPPMLLLHPGPGTAGMQVPLVARLGRERRVYAPDVLGMGDSCPPKPEGPDGPGIPYYADASFRIADAIGLEKFDVFASALGARIAVEMAISHPERIRRMVVNKFDVFPENMLDEFHERHGPRITPDEHGQYVTLLWQRMLRLYTYRPWWRDGPKAYRGLPLPSAELLHVAFIEQVKSATTMYMPLKAVFRHDIVSRLPLVKVPIKGREEGAKYIEGAEVWTPSTETDPVAAEEDDLEAFASDILEFLNRE